MLTDRARCALALRLCLFLALWPSASAGERTDLGQEVLIVPDLTGDGILELVATVKWGEEAKLGLYWIDGKDGAVLGVDELPEDYDLKEVRPPRVQEHVRAHPGALVGSRFQFCWLNAPTPLLVSALGETRLPRGIPYYGYGGTKETGDRDGDGVPDLLVVTESEESKRRTILHLASATGATMLEVPCPIADRSFGDALLQGSDLTGDSIPDLIVGSHEWPNFSGSVVAFDGQDASVLWTSSGHPDGFCPLGSRLLPLPDLDGDEVGDILGTACSDGCMDRNDNWLGGFLRAISAKSGRTLWELQRPGLFLGSGFGGEVCVVPDYDDDGLPDLAATEANEIAETGVLMIVSSASGKILREIEFDAYIGTSLTFTGEQFVIGGGYFAGHFGDDGFLGGYSVSGELVWSLRGRDLPGIVEKGR